MNAPALQRTISDMIEEYDAKSAVLDQEIRSLGEAAGRLEMATCVGGTYGGDIWWRGKPSVDEKAAHRALLVSAWKAIHTRLNIDLIASANDKRKWEVDIANPPPLTRENVVLTFGDYLLRTRFHLLKGLAEVFVDLDPAYKSHSKVKIGVAGLPKRVILQSVGGWGSYGRDRLRDLLNALAAYQAQPLIAHDEFAALDALHSYTSGSKAGEVQIRGLRVRKFVNGNAHVIFGPDLLLDINRALAEFYGEVLPDAEGEEPSRKPSTAVAKDLQFYPTPQAVIAEIVEAASIPDLPGLRNGWRDQPAPLRVLEPSCGDGRIMRAISKRGHSVVGIEVHPGRAEKARQSGLSVVTSNFLEQPAEPTFDRVVMNPRFYGRHYLHHVRHALRFLKPGGLLVTVLPATAWYDHGELKGRWQDLPVVSFAESGTNIPTGYLVMWAPE
ncbi:Methyltransferase domain-containing protein [Kaistia soli DSM 19436]|uniref:Methyltransferase domain-containing protein n=1 Tax=Kaistia soli DSM 19436 TaxID=1122133 RepID=A0A1M5MNU3_9HYPH|nr:class I SAM-dependent methyltransferase [Kaistia soli]SHG79094.1 Methyltransferase domain-containing protein [Kaistia soli DSM 19436]